MVQIENALCHPLQLEIRSQQLCVEVIAPLFQLFTVVGKVPALQRQFRTMVAGIKTYLQQVFLGKRQCCLKHIKQKFAQFVSAVAHAVAEHITAIVVETKQLCLLMAEIGYFANDLVVVVVIAAIAPAVVGAPNLLAQGAVVGIGDERTERRVGQREHPALQFALLCLGAGGLYHVRRQAGQVFSLRNVQDVIVVVSQHISVHLLRQLRQSLAVLGKSLARFSFQVYAVAFKTLVRVLQQGALLRGQVQLVALLIHGLYPFKQFLVHIHLV